MDIQIIYTSRANTPFSDSELDQLLAHCVSRNTPENFTGMLLYGNGKFMQVLEGDADKLDLAMKQISQDKHHHDVNILVRTPIKQRDFSEWSMGFRRVDRDCDPDLAHFAAFFDENFEMDRLADPSSFALSVLKAFAYPRSFEA